MPNIYIALGFPMEAGYEPTSSSLEVTIAYRCTTIDLDFTFNPIWDLGQLWQSRNRDSNYERDVHRSGNTT